MERIISPDVWAALCTIAECSAVAWKFTVMAWPGEDGVHGVVHVEMNDDGPY
jgi:hypothetical protein